MKNMFFNSVLVAFVLLVASCSKQPEAKVDVMSFNIRLDHVADSLNNWKYRKDAAAQMIAYYTPDVVGMQEVLKNQLDDLKNRLPQYTALGWVAMGVAVCEKNQGGIPVKPRASMPVCVLALARWRFRFSENPILGIKVVMLFVNAL